jgi:hypothetical protein
MLFIMRRSPLYVPLMKAGSVLLSLIAMAWATERIFDYDTSVSSLVEPVLLWPRSAFVVAACYVFAIVLWWAPAGATLWSRWSKTLTPTRRSATSPNQSSFGPDQSLSPGGRCQTDRWRGCSCCRRVGQLRGG